MHTVTHVLVCSHLSDMRHTKGDREGDEKDSVKCFQLLLELPDPILHVFSGIGLSGEPSEEY